MAINGYISAPDDTRSPLSPNESLVMTGGTTQGANSVSEALSKTSWKWGPIDPTDCLSVWLCKDPVSPAEIQ